MIGQLFSPYRGVTLRSTRRGQQLWPLPGAWPNAIRLLGSDTGSGDGSSGSKDSTSPPPSEGGFKTRFRRYMPRQRPYQLPRWVPPEEVDAMIDDSGRATNPHSSEREPLDYDTKREASMDPVNVVKRYDDPVKRALRREAFGNQSHAQALKTITGEQAWRDYGLTASDRTALPSMHRLGVVFDSSDVTVFFNKFEVQDAALAKYRNKPSYDPSVDSTGLAGLKASLQARERKRLAARARVQASKGGMLSEWVRRRRPNVESGQAASGNHGGLGFKAVKVAMVGNTAVLIAKVGAYLYSGSGAMLSEAIHSGADVANQGLLYYGLQRSSERADKDHPYGYGFETYVWCMISAVGSFFLGAGASVYHGTTSLYVATAPHSLPAPISDGLTWVKSMTSSSLSTTSAPSSLPTLPPPLLETSGALVERAGGGGGGSGTELANALTSQASALDSAVALAQAEAVAAHAAAITEAAPVALLVLAVAGMLESYSGLVAWRELKKEAKKTGLSVREYIVDGPDPVNVAVFLEDAIAVGGVGVAAAGIGLTALTGSGTYDAVGSIGIGLLMGGVSAFIVSKNRRLLGQAVPDSKLQVVELLLKDEVVMSCQDVKAVIIRPGVCRFKAEIQFNPTTLANHYLDQHPGNLPGIRKSFTRALQLSSTTSNSSFSHFNAAGADGDGSLRDSTSSSSLDTFHPSSDIRLNQSSHAHHNDNDAERQAEALRVELHRYSRMLLLTLALEVDRLEQLIRKHHPEYQYIDLEVL